MEEINLMELLSYFLEKSKIIIITVLVCLLCGLVYTGFIKDAMYKSDVSVVLVSKNSSMSQNDIMVNQKLASTYRELVESRSVLSKVIKNLDLDYSIKELQEMIVVESVNDTEILKIVVSSKDPKEAVKIANETASVFEKEISKIYNLENVSIVDKAMLAKEPYNVIIIKDIIIYIGVGLVLSVGVLFVIYYFDNSVKSVEQIERQLGVAVIGTVPTVGKKG